MRVLFSCMPWPSHLYPMVPLAWGLVARGHEVRVASTPSLTPTTTATGLVAVECGEDLWASSGTRVDDGKEGTPERGEFVKTHFADTLLDNTAKMATDMIELARAWQPDLIVYAPLSYAAQATAQRLGIPAVEHLWGVADASDLHRKTEADTQAAVWQRLGLDTVDLSGHLTVDPCPPSMQEDLPGHRQLQRYVPYNGSGRAASTSEGVTGRPKVCVTWGMSTPTMTGDMALARRTVGSLAEREIDIVVAVAQQHEQLLGELPGARIAVSQPLGSLLADCDLIVHHGGPGTMFTAAAAGLPQLVIPISAGQFLNADKLSGTGAGRVLDAETAPEAVVATVAELLAGDAEQAAARRLREEMAAQPSPAEVAAVVELFARDGARVGVGAGSAD